MNLDPTDKFYADYCDLCKRAVADPKVFSTFRSDPVCITVVDGCWEEIGSKCIPFIGDEYDYLFERLYIGDQIGDPLTFYYKEIGMMLCPTTLRYGKIACDIASFFDLKNMNIVEIGVGYGGQCKVIHDIVKPKSYTLVDYPEVLSLSKKYLDRFGVKPIFREMSDISKTKYDLVISNYALSEMDPSWREFYVDHIITPSRSGFLVCNNISLEDIAFQVNKDGIMLPEIPLTADGNFVYVWNYKEQ